MTFDNIIIDLKEDDEPKLKIHFKQGDTVLYKGDKAYVVAINNHLKDSAYLTLSGWRDYKTTVVPLTRKIVDKIQIVK